MKQVRDPMGSDEWIDCDGETDEDAVRTFLREQDYDESAYDPAVPLVFLVRSDEDDVPRKIEVRVIPMHFRVGRGR